MNSANESYFQFNCVEMKSHPKKIPGNTKDSDYHYLYEKNHRQKYKKNDRDDFV